MFNPVIPHFLWIILPLLLTISLREWCQETRGERHTDLLYYWQSPETSFCILCLQRLQPQNSIYFCPLWQLLTLAGTLKRYFWWTTRSQSLASTCRSSSGTSIWYLSYKIWHPFELGHQDLNNEYLLRIWRVVGQNWLPWSLFRFPGPLFSSLYSCLLGWK